MRIADCGCIEDWGLGDWGLIDDWDEIVECELPIFD
jgi:hypothetical protein